MKADLHMHTTSSDGKKTPFELIDLAIENSVDIIAITDHDVIKDVDQIKTYADEKGIRYLPGIELSTKHMDKPVHLLGYFTDESYLNKEMVEYKEKIKAKRERRAKEMIARIEKYYGLIISYKDVVSFSTGIIARPHIAKAILKNYPEYTMEYIFKNFICDMCEGYVPSAELGVQEGIDLLHRNNCVVVLAHPVLVKEHIKEYVYSLNYDGLEAVYYLNSVEDEEYYRALAMKRDMIVTGGSDYHGIENDKTHGFIGERYIEGEDLKAFLELIEVKKNER